MASQADIETVLVNVIAALLNPQQGQALDPNVTIARGWPTEADIRTAVGQKICLIGVYAHQQAAKDITTNLRCWRTLSPGVGALEVGRMEQVFKLDLWAPTPDRRDALCGALMSALRTQLRYALPDGSTATLSKLELTGPNDLPARADEWAQSLEITLIYPVLLVQEQVVVVEATQTTSIMTP